MTGTSMTPSTEANSAKPRGRVGGKHSLVPAAAAGP